MKEEKKDRIAKAFDADEMDYIGSEARSAYTDELKRIDTILKAGTTVPVPRDFEKAVAGRLPSAAARVKSRLLVFYKPLLFLLTLVVSIVFADALGITGLAEALQEVFQAAASLSMTMVFIICSSACILLMVSLMVVNLNSIRSRRIER